MKILALSGSPRGPQSRTLQLVQAVAKGAHDAGAEVELVDVCRLRIGYCIGCGVCYASGRCIHRDDFDGLYARMFAADGLVLGSPNYFHTVSAQLKALLDRMADTVHCQLFTGKYACAVATAGGAAAHEVTEYLSRVLVGLGANTVGAVGTSPSLPGAMETATREADALGRTLVEAIRTKRVYPEQEAVHQEMRHQFRQLVTMNKDVWKHEFQYWRNLRE